MRARPEGDDAVTFSVTDTGIGIAEEFHASIFQDFVQIDSPLQRKWRGTGLGFSLSKKIAELLGGSVSMTSQPGVGSTFSVTIPIRFEEPQPAAAERGRAAPKAEGQMMPNSPATILVVDDNPATLYATARVLKGAGFRVVEAGTGEAALALAEKEPSTWSCST